MNDDRQRHKRMFFWTSPPRDYCFLWSLNKGHLSLPFCRHRFGFKVIQTSQNNYPTNQTNLWASLNNSTPKNRRTNLPQYFRNIPEIWAKPTKKHKKKQKNLVKKYSNQRGEILLKNIYFSSRIYIYWCCSATLHGTRSKRQSRNRKTK